MLVERFFPSNSSNYQKFKSFFNRLGDTLDEKDIIQLFTIWTFTVSGFVLDVGLNDRFVYWEWSGWLLGSIKLGFVTAIFLMILKPKEIWVAGNKRMSLNEFWTHLGIVILFLIIGWINLDSSFNELIKLIPYALAFIAGLTIFQFIVEYDQTKGEWYNLNWEKKELFLGSSATLLFISILLGFYFDDPIISTASIISLPFPVIALLWSSHVRHLQRARFYPLFILAMLLCVRAPWFFIPLAGLFYMLRTVNYFRYGIVHPSFGVDLPEDL
ncbi:MAG: hypothetical protein HOB40_06140 [Candidatus Marinimicrobia bacterium]|jgi:hypothetical protein|nr:hypothetical protein [Candidatus Neomarinimicrobiota bacterium]MBT3501434.1 hypothetical protein [Candidatus Neomarinimicrobiota bacterium]MBT3839427.1 hypothetical protein [Candidatus Neomarinimicrobiota bacterium]MBT3998588.1 hypothetical protein [Candidatus Neomarinimicrobiota bacterium]MBT4283060.1 hypothetical protein [Candidatus Neomarinimicrobiota bacterium]